MDKCKVDHRQVLLKALSTLKRKGLLEPRHKACLLVHVKRIFKKKKIIIINFLKNY